MTSVPSLVLKTKHKSSHTNQKIQKILVWLQLAFSFRSESPLPVDFLGPLSEESMLTTMVRSQRTVSAWNLNEELGVASLIQNVSERLESWRKASQKKK